MTPQHLYPIKQQRRRRPILTLRRKKKEPETKQLSRNTIPDPELPLLRIRHYRKTTLPKTTTTRPANCTAARPDGVVQQAIQSTPPSAMILPMNQDTSSSSSAFKMNILPTLHSRIRPRRPTPHGTLLFQPQECKNVRLGFRSSLTFVSSLE